VKEARLFSEIDAFLADGPPLSPFGRAAREKEEFLSERAPLEREYDLVERLLSFLRADGAAAERVEGRLRRMPPLDFDLDAPLGLGELFLLKKFLLNVRAAFAELPEALRAELGAAWESEELYRALCRGGGEEEVFRISEEGLPALKDVRARIRTLEAELRHLQDRKLSEIRERCGLEFSGREFLVLPEAEARRHFGDADLFIEPHDASRVVVKPVFGPRPLELSAARERLLEEERAREAEVLSSLSAAAAREGACVRGYGDAVGHLDALLAKARLAQRHRLVRPRLLDFGAAVTVRGGRHVPLEERNRALGLDYTPLECALEARVGILRGSNMGGKTAALKTLALLQLLAQTGHFVPAEAFETPLFERLDYVGEGPREEPAGLSSFGLELHALLAVLRGRSARRLVLMDEFAKTTNSAEGAALLSAVLHVFARTPSYYALVSTHLSGLALPEGVAAWRMRGFDEKAFKDFLGAETGGTLTERLARIHRYMRYELVADDASPRAGDALKVARVLGLDADVVDSAERLLALQADAGKG
jgi:hypothetical protein